MSTTTKIRLPTPFAGSTKEYLSAVAAFVAEYRWLTALHTYDILNSDDFFGKTWPIEWSFLLHDIHKDPVKPLIDILLHDAPIPLEWPESLREYVRKCKELQLDRAVIAEEFGFDDGNPPSWNMVIGEHETTKAAMTRKKLHEVERLSRVVFQTAKASGVDVIVDVGAGQGYLTHRLAENHPVIALDFNEIQTKGSVYRGSLLQRQTELQTLRDVRKTSSSATEAISEATLVTKFPIRHITEMIDTERLAELVERLAGEDASSERKKYMLVGLHACGDLSASTMLQTFVSCPSVRSVVVVPCCYNLLSEADDPHDSNSQHGFPLSNHLKGIAKDLSLVLTHRGRNLGCQTVSRHTEEEIMSSLEGTHRRALAEAISSTLRPRDCSIDKIRFRASKRAKTGDLKQFLSEFMEPLDIPREEWEPALGRFPHSERVVSVFWLVRALIAPVLESMMLVDRVVYLEEQSKTHGGGECNIRLLNLFDFSESARNIVLTATKS